MISLAFAVCNFCYAVFRYKFAAVHYDMHVRSLSLEFAYANCSYDYARTVALWSLIRTFS